MNVKIQRATKSRAESVFRNLREADRREVDTAAGFKAGEVEQRTEMLLAGWKASKVAYALTVDGRTVAVLGLLPTPLAAVVWMLCTDEVSLAPKTILTRCRDIAAKWHRRYGTLLCVADDRNTLHQRWIKLIGFNFEGKVDQNGYPFSRFLYRGRR